MRLAYQAVAGGVVAEGELGFAGVEIAAGEQQFAVAVALEAVAGSTLKTP